jgi:hypothetical protein
MVSRRVSSLVLVCGLCASQMVPQDERAIPGHQPDTGAEWTYNQSTDRAGLYATGSNAAFAQAGLAEGQGRAYDASAE